MGTDLCGMYYYSENGVLMKAPSILLLTQILAHPLLVISARVMYNQSNGHDKNMFKCVKNTFKTQGIAGFYRGFVPLTLLTIALRYEHFYYMVYGKEYHNIEEEYLELREKYHKK